MKNEKKEGVKEKKSCVFRYQEGGKKVYSADTVICPSAVSECGGPSVCQKIFDSRKRGRKLKSKLESSGIAAEVTELLSWGECQTPGYPLAIS